MPEPVRCDACDRRIVVGPVLRDDDGNRYGPRCGRARGLAPERRRRARKPAPVRAEQSALAGWDEINNESEEPMTYIQDAIDAVNAELPDLDPELARLYALLAVAIGEGVTWRYVHDAWAVWHDRTQPDHRSIVPFDELAPDVQELDEPYAEGIRRAARKLEARRG